MSEQNTFLAYWFYAWGDIFCRLYMWKSYQRAMDRSVGYDPEGRIWKDVEDR